jgi:peroxiredoxin
MGSRFSLLPGRSLAEAVLRFCAALTLALPAIAPAATWPDEVPDFAMLDINGRYYEFHHSDARAVVLFFTENGCPVARQGIHKLKALREQFAERDVALWIVDASTSDDLKSISKEAKDLGVARTLPFLRDDSQGVAHLLGVTRTATAVAISTKDGRVIYHGPVDDQFSEGASKPEAQQNYLADALRAFMAGQPVKEASVPTHGCLLKFEPSFQGTNVNYASDVAPVLEKNCLSCHSPGNIGPFSLSDYQKVRSKSDMIQEVLLSRRMPPWSADRSIGHFVGEPTMNLDETRTLLGWIAQGAKRGEGEDPLPQAKVPPAPYWPLGEPDFIVKLPQPEEIPASGVLEYRHIKIKVPVTEDTWLSGVSIHPGNRKVVHHSIVRVKSSQGGDDGSGRGMFLQGWAPGYQPERFPEGTGRLLSAGSTLDVEMHYTTMGSPQTDQTEIGFYKLAAKPEVVLETHAAVNQEFSIPPDDSDAQTFAVCAVKSDSRLIAMAPHMHLRGSWMRYEALYPNGKRETLLSVPHYDFNWQTGYRLVQPKLLPKGTWILCTGGFDNSPQNPNNPAPAKRVVWGDQSFEEMFIGFLDITAVPEATHSSPNASVRDPGGRATAAIADMSNSTAPHTQRSSE